MSPAENLKLKSKDFGLSDQSSISFYCLGAIGDLGHSHESLNFGNHRWPISPAQRLEPERFAAEVVEEEQRADSAPESKVEAPLVVAEEEADSAS